VGATIAGRAGLVAIPLGLGLRAITGFAPILAGASLGHHARLIDWGVTLLAARPGRGRLGLPLATRR